MLNFLRDHVVLESNLLQLHIEEDYWKQVIQLAMSAIKRLSFMPKNITRENSINWDYPRTENNLRHRLNLINNKVQQAKHKLNTHCLHNSVFVKHENTNDSDLSMAIINDATTNLIENGLTRWRQYFEQRKIILSFDIQEVQLVKSFYELNPDKKTGFHSDYLYCIPHNSHSS